MRPNDCDILILIEIIIFESRQDLCVLLSAKGLKSENQFFQNSKPNISPLKRNITKKENCTEQGWCKRESAKEIGVKMTEYLAHISKLNREGGIQTRDDPSLPLVARTVS